MEQSKWQKAGVHRKIKQSTAALKKLKCLARKFIFRIGAESGPWPFGFVLNRLLFVDPLATFNAAPNNLTTSAPKERRGRKNFTNGVIFMFSWLKGGL